MQKINQELINEFLDKSNVFAVVGVSKESEKYGNRVYFDLKRAGYIVYPVNPNAIEISGNKCYSKLRSLPTLPDVVDIVVPPKITEKTVKECKDLGISKIWMQPGSESEEAIRFCTKNDIKVLYGVCVMLERKRYN
jgi:predicted CoA-binding protein